MPETVDKWSILIALKTLLFKQGINDVKSGTKEATKSINDMVDSIKSIALATGAVLGLRATLNTFSTNAQQLDVLSTTTGENIQMLQAWKLAAESMGISGNGVINSIKGIDDAMGRVRTTGFDQMLVPLHRLGIAVRDNNGQLRKGADIYADFAKKIVNLDTRTGLDFAHQLGFSDEEYYMMKRMGGNVDGFMGKYKQLASLKQKDIEKNRELQQTMADLKQLWVALAQKIAEYAIPVIKGLAEAFGVLLQYKPAVYAMLGGLILLIVGGLITAAKAAIAPILALGATLWTALAPIVAVLAPIVAGILAIMYAVKKFGEFIGIFDKNSDFFSGDWTKPSADYDPAKGSKMWQNINRTMPGSRNTSNAVNNAGNTYQTSTTKVGTVNINTKATNAREIAIGFSDELAVIGNKGGSF